MKTLSQHLKNLFTALLFLGTILTHQHLRAQDNSVMEVKINYLTQKITVSYRASIVSYFPVGSYTNFLEFYVDGVLVEEKGNEYIGTWNYRIYEFELDLPRYKENLYLRVKELKTDHGSKGDVHNEANETILISLNFKDNNNIFTAVPSVKPNSCNGELIYTFGEVPSETTIKAVAHQSDWQVIVQKGQGGIMSLYFDKNFPFNRVTYSVKGRADSGEYDLSIRRHNVLHNSVSFYLPSDKLSFKADYNHSYPVLIKFFMPSGVISAVIPVLVVGTELDLNAAKTTVGAPIPQMILHNIPGDGSSTFTEMTTEICNEVSTGFEEGTGVNTELTVKVGVAGDVAGVPFEAYAEGGASTSQTNTTASENGLQFCGTTNNEVIGRNDYEGTDGDTYIGTITTCKYGPSIEIAHNCQGLTVKKGIGLEAQKVNTFAFTGYFIKNNIISDLELATQQNDSIQNIVNAWNDMIMQNEAYVNNALANASASFPIESTVERKSYTGYSRTESYSSTSQVFIDNNIFAEAGFEVAGSGAKASTGVSMTTTVTNNTSNSTNTSTSIGYTLYDDESADEFYIYQVKDYRFGSDIFGLDQRQSATSCPYEGGKKRDLPELTIGAEKVTSLVIDEVPIGDGEQNKASIMLNVCNRSEAMETRSYYLRVAESQSAVIEYSGAPLTNQGIIIRDIPSGGCRPVSITIDQPAVNIDTFKGIVLELTDACGGDADITSQVELDVYFGRKAPEEGIGLLGTYFHSLNFTNEVLNRIDETVDFDWGSGSPDASIRSEVFTVRWEGEVVAANDELYTFYTTTDDGIRLWVNDQLIVNQWMYQPPTEVSGSIQMEAGKKVNIKMEYFEYYGGAVAQLAWSSPSQVKEIIPKAHLFPKKTEAEILTVTPGIHRATFSAGSFDFTVTSNTDWSVSSNDPSWLTVTSATGSNNGFFTANFTENTGEQARAAELTVITSGGLPQVVVIAQGPRPCTITNATLDVSLCFDNGTPFDPTDDYYEYSLAPLGANFGASYSVFANGVAIKTGVFYGQRTVIDQPSVDTEVGVISIVDDTYSSCSFNVNVEKPTCPTINYPDYLVTYLSEPPATVNAGQAFPMLALVKNEGNAVFNQGTKAYYWLSPNPQLNPLTDSLLATVNIDPLSIGQSYPDIRDISVPAGIPTNVYYLFFKVDGDEQITEEDEGNNIVMKELNVIGISQNTGGLLGSYFDNQDLTNLKYSRIDINIDFNWGFDAPAPLIDTTTYSIRWEGEIEAEYSELYTFYTRTDDGVRLWIDGRLIIDQWVDQPPTELVGYINMVAGRKVSIRMEYFERYHSSRAHLSWSSVSQVKEIVPQVQLTPPTNLPDYQVTFLSEPPINVTAGSNFRMNARITNTGTRAFNGKTKGQYWLSLDTRLDPQTDSLLKDAEDNIDPLGVGGYNDDGETIYIPAGMPSRMYYLIYQADAAGQIFESEEENNIMWKPININAPAFKLADPESDISQESAALLQNYPNPSNKQTRIPFYIPTDVREAKIQIVGIEGKVFTTIHIEDQARGDVLVSTENLSQGMWLYRLILDDVLIDTKKMFVTH